MANPDCVANPDYAVNPDCVVDVVISTFALCMVPGIYGGFLLGVRSVNGLAFYDWENTELIRRIEIQPKHVSLQVTHTHTHTHKLIHCDGLEVQV